MSRTTTLKTESYFGSTDQGTWVWVADHDLDPPNAQLSLFNGRGLYSQSAGPVWMIGTGMFAMPCHLVAFEY